MSYHVEGTCSSPFTGQCPGKLIWPELFGRKGKEAKDVIEKERPSTDVIYVPQDVIITNDYCCNRVRIFVDAKPNGDYANAKVIVVPRVG
ncbi:hypothetical protein ZWY2020_048989 [Hordeum vulgare]|nr:hypothetical protein ZWY2020_048989 [Hordeum vulgare]